MKDLNAIKLAVSDLVNALMQDPTSFENFSIQLIELGIDRMTYDSVKNESSFYMGDRFICALVRSDIQNEMSKSFWELGKEFNASLVQKAIHQLDAGLMTALEFHREIYSAGVVICCVYLLKRKIYYLGVDAQYYLEQY